MGKVCAFFGHREIYQDIGPRLEQAIVSAMKLGYDVFWCGGYGAFDLSVAGTIHRFKKTVSTHTSRPNSGVLDRTSDS